VAQQYQKAEERAEPSLGAVQLKQVLESHPVDEASSCRTVSVAPKLPGLVASAEFVLVVRTWAQRHELLDLQWVFLVACSFQAAVPSLQV
jgi:hypothetical protein